MVVEDQVAKNNLNLQYHKKLAIYYQGLGEISLYHALSKKLAVPLYQAITPDIPESFFLSWRDDCLKLLDRDLLIKGGLCVEIEPRYGEQHSWPAPKKGALAQALGRKTKTIIDATTGWGQDSLFIFRMGYELRCIERSPVMIELLADGFKRLAHLGWVKNHAIKIPELIAGNASEWLINLEHKPECIYIDPMFPLKRKKSALAKKSMTVLRDLLGNDEDKDQLFSVAFDVATKRVVVKRPEYADPLNRQPNQSFKSKLLRYDVYFKN